MRLISMAAAKLTEGGWAPKGFAHGPRASRVFLLPAGLTLLFLGFVFLPPVRGNPQLIAAFTAVGSGLLLWLGILFVASRRKERVLSIQFVPVRSHYVQALVQLGIYVYFGWYWREVLREAPLILAQILFLYIFAMLLSWSRRDACGVGFGPVPIILSTNLFIWFRDDWFIFQFLLVATGALGKEFIRWRRDGNWTHIFNPSALSLSLFSLVLIPAGATRFTWGEELATMLGAPPNIYLLVFLGGLVVQLCFSVTLMTFAAAAALGLLNLAYTGTTGVYFFVDSNIPIAVFLGLHLLMTDPSTSPRTNLGRLIFGGLYGAGVFVTYGLLAHFGAPRFYDKLLIVPLLNLSVQAIDRFARSGLAGRFTRWEAAFPPGRLNLFHVAGWAALFGVMLQTGFVQARHPGESIAFWQKAAAENRPNALGNLRSILEFKVREGSGEAANELGIFYQEGKLTPRDPARAAFHFSRGCDLGNAEACANVAIQALFLGSAIDGARITRALDRLESAPEAKDSARNHYLLGTAYEIGLGRAKNLERAREHYAQGCEQGEAGACKNLGRMRLHGQGGAIDLAGAVQALERAAASGDAQSAFYLAPLYGRGQGVAKNEKRALELLEKACQLGLAEACDALKVMARHGSGVPSNK